MPYSVYCAVLCCMLCCARLKWVKNKPSYQAPTQVNSLFWAVYVVCVFLNVFALLCIVGCVCCDAYAVLFMIGVYALVSMLYSVNGTVHAVL
jgi:hypothetical protein